MNPRKNVINRYILLAIFLTSCLMLLKKSDFFNNIQDSLNLRDLSYAQTLEYSCDKSGSRLLDKYSGDYNEETGKAQESLTEAQQAIIDFARDSKYSNIKPYLKRVAIFIVFLCLAVIFLFLWISYWGCCCCNSCLFSTSKGGSFMTLLSYIISVFCLLLVIIFSIIILSLTKPFFRRVNGIFCSTLKFLEHLLNGLGTDYPPHIGEWYGLNHAIDRFNNSYEMLKTIDDDLIDKTYDKAYQSCSMETDCGCDPDGLEEIKGYWDNFYSFTILALDIPTQMGKMKGGFTVLGETKIKVGDDIYDFLHDYANKHIRNICIAIFVLTLIIAVLALIFLTLYYCLKSSISRIVYIVLWNLSMLFMILAIIVSVVFGVLGYVAKDGVQIAHYTLSKNNIESDDPLFFKKKNTYVSSLVNECANDDGNFLDTFGNDILNSTGEMDVDFGETLDALKNSTCSAETKKACEDFILALYNGTRIYINATGSFLNIQCRFARNDKNILLNEVNSVGKRALVLSSFQFLVGILLGISALFGILLVHKYKERITHSENREVYVNQNRNNESQGNFVY